MDDETLIFAMKEVSALALSLSKNQHIQTFFHYWGSYLSEHRRNDDGTLSCSTWDASSIKRAFLHCIGAFQYVLDLRSVRKSFGGSVGDSGCFCPSSSAVRFVGLRLLLSVGTHVTCGSPNPGSFCGVEFVPRWMVFLCRYNNLNHPERWLVTILSS